MFLTNFQKSNSKLSHFDLEHFRDLGIFQRAPRTSQDFSVLVKRDTKLIRLLLNYIGSIGKLEVTQKFCLGYICVDTYY